MKSGGHLPESINELSDFSPEERNANLTAIATDRSTPRPSNVLNELKQNERKAKFSAHGNWFTWANDCHWEVSLTGCGYWWSSTIPTAFSLLLLSILCPMLTKMFHSSLNQAHSPSTWKKAADLAFNKISLPSFLGDFRFPSLYWIFFLKYFRDWYLTRSAS